MDEYYVLLDLGTARYAVWAGHFESIIYQTNGYVDQFKFKGIWYITTVFRGTDQFYGILNRDVYIRLKKLENEIKQKNLKKEITKEEWKAGQFTFNDIGRNFLDTASNGAVIQGCLEYVGTGGVCKRFYLYTYNGTIPTPADFKQYATVDATREPIDCRKFKPHTQAGDFYEAYSNYPLLKDGDTVADPALVAEIAHLLEGIDEVINQSWNEFLGNEYSTENFHKMYHPGAQLPAAMYTWQQFYSYKQGLERWLQLLAKRKKELTRLKSIPYGKLLMLLFTMNREAMLKPLPVQIKINVLTAMANHSLIEMFWDDYTFSFHDTEALALNIVYSVTDAQASDFINLLEQTMIEEQEIGGLKTRNLYMVLFKAINDYFGDDNFTKFVYRINYLVCVKNNVASIPGATYNQTTHLYEIDEAQLTSLKTSGVIKHSFFWREEGVLDTTDYKVSTNTAGTKLTIREELCDQTESVRRVVSSGTGYAPSYEYEQEICTHKKLYEFSNISHFSLVYFQFYNHPSFIDINEDQGNYKGRQFFGFAGFFYYLQIKEKSFWNEIIFEACLYAIAVLAPFGQVVVAMRDLEYLHALVGVLSMAGNTAVYLTNHTPFTNYLHEKYPDDYEDIIHVLDDLGFLSFFTGPTKPVSEVVQLGEDIVGKLPRTTAAAWVGAAREVVRDSKAMATLSASQQQLLRNLVRAVEGQLYKYRGIPEITNEILEQQGKLKYFSNVATRYQLMNLLDVYERRAFLRNFGSLTGIHKIWMDRYGAPFIKRWKEFSQAEKQAARLNPQATISELSTALRYEVKYVDDLPKVRIADLSNAYLEEKYGSFAIVMRDKVNVFANAIRTDPDISAFRSYEGRASVAMFYDAQEGIESEIMHAYPTKVAALENGPLQQILKNYPGSPSFNPAQPVLHPNVKDLLGELTTFEGKWKSQLTPKQLERLDERVFRHADLRAFNDLCIKKWGFQRISKAEFDEWCNNYVYWYQELLKPSHINGMTVKQFIIHDPCAICFYPTLLVNKIR